jgi:hypothetical protein
MVLAKKVACGVLAFAARRALTIRWTERWTDKVPSFYTIAGVGQLNR